MLSLLSMAGTICVLEPKMASFQYLKSAQGWFPLIDLSFAHPWRCAAGLLDCLGKILCVSIQVRHTLLV